MIFSYIVVFTCVWWVVFYMVLPFGVKTISPSKFGYDSGAPKNPHLGLKIIITSIIALALTIGIVYLIEQGYLSKWIDNYTEWLYVATIDPINLLTSKITINSFSKG